MEAGEKLAARRLALGRERRIRRRQASLCFLGAGISFGTALYTLRVHFAQVTSPEKRIAFAGLLAIICALFWLGTRAEAEVSRIEEELRQLDES